VSAAASGPARTAERPAAAPPDRAGAERGPDEPPLHRAEALLQGGPCARIALRDQVYLLRLTRSGKLILTK
jgi:hemin uptake protein HemP